MLLRPKAHRANHAPMQQRISVEWSARPAAGERAAVGGGLACARANGSGVQGSVAIVRLLNAIAQR